MLNCFSPKKKSVKSKDKYYWNHLQSNHVSSGKTASDNGIIVMFDSATTKLSVIEGGSVSSHPNVSPGFKFGVDNESTIDGIQFKVGRGGQLALGLDAGGNDNMIASDGVAVGGRNLDLAISELFCLLDAGFVHDIHAILFELFHRPLGQIIGKDLENKMVLDLFG